MKRAVCLVFPLLASLGCSGLWVEATNEVAADEFRQQLARLSSVKDGPEKTYVRVMLEKGVEDSATGAFGVLELVEFGVIFDRAVEDDVLTEKEVKQLREKYKDISRS